MRILTGVQPSGELHIGNYFGAIRPCIDLQEQGESFLFIADYHAMTQIPDPQLLRERVRQVAIDFLACGVDPEKTVFFRQSDIPEVTVLTWILSCYTTVGLLERCHSYKDKLAQGIVPNHGLFSYPVLMAADILLYHGEVVPVGKDQKQHLEVTRDIAQRFNHLYGDILTIPEPRIRDDLAFVPGLDGRKMSKSYGNTIPIFGAEKKMRKKIMKIVTDATPMEAPKDPDSCNIFALYRLFADEQKVESLRQRYLAGGLGYGHAKQELFEEYWAFFSSMRTRREALLADPERVDAILQRGAERAREVAKKTLTAVSIAVGLR